VRAQDDATGAYTDYDGGVWWSFTVGRGGQGAEAPGGEALMAVQAAAAPVAAGCASDGVWVRCTDRQDVTAGHYRVTVPTIAGLQVWVDAQPQTLTATTKPSGKKAPTSAFEVDLTEGNHTIQLEYPAGSLATVISPRWERIGPIADSTSVTSGGGGGSMQTLTIGPAFTVEHYHLDALGSVRAVTDATGALLRRHEFLPFGEEWQPPAPPTDTRLFTGQERDAGTGLDYFRARYYYVSIGRFTTPDVPGVDQYLADSQSWNLYAYARNNPLRYIDPSGRYVWAPSGCSRDNATCENDYTQNQQRFRDGLTRLRDLVDSLPKDSDAYARLSAALAAYGQEGDDNGVTVGFRTLPGNAAATTDPAGDMTHYKVWIDPDKTGGGVNMWAVNTGHEGAHISDFNLVRDNRDLAGLFTSFFQQEYRAYWVSSLIAQGLRMPTLPMVTGMYIWNRAWAAADRDNIRAVAIALHVDRAGAGPIPPIWDPLKK
jgi:RHS repeat-associated protein